MSQVFLCEQGSPEWFAARLGIPTASEYATILARGKDGGASIGRRTYMLKLAGEIITGRPMEAYSNAHMERGKEMEAEARDFYSYASNAELTRVGFIHNGITGCSPDALVGANGMLEIKTALPHILIPHLLKGEFPAEHQAQCQGNLMVAERAWIDLMIYWPQMPLFQLRAQRDDSYIARLADAVERFNAELHALVEQVRRCGGPL